MTLVNTTSRSAVEVGRTKDLIRASIESRREQLLGLSHAIGNDPEEAFQEHRASARVAGVLEDAGFQVSRGVHGLETAVEATFGEGDVTVAVLGEYDSLPGIGHACGHNIIAAAGVGAAIGLKPVAEALGIRIKFLGTPAEELGGGKILMLQQGAWDDVTFSLMVHGGSRAQVAHRGSLTQACERIIVTFRGRTSHAAAAPHDGVNAGHAVTLAQVGLGLLRQHLRKTVVVNAFIVESGHATNVIAETGVIEVEIRGNTQDEFDDARHRVREVLRGAAISTGCRLEVVQPELPYAPMSPDDDLARLFDAAMSEDLGYELRPPAEGQSGGSTDMGNVSQYLPAIHPIIALLGVDVVPHHRSFAEAALSPAGDEAALNGALAMAFTVAEAVSDEVLRDRLLREQRARLPYSEPGDSLSGELHLG